MLKKDSSLTCKKRNFKNLEALIVLRPHKPRSKNILNQPDPMQDNKQYKTKIKIFMYALKLVWTSKVLFKKKYKDYKSSLCRKIQNIKNK